jgi:branched-chain amino acid aminotransferase
MIDGRFVAPEDATVSVFDRGFLYGDSVFETLRTYGGKPYKLDEHLERLQQSAGRVFISMPLSKPQLAAEVHAALERAGNTESYVRLMITRGQGELGLDPSRAEHPLRVSIVAELKPLPAELYARGISVISFKTRRASDHTGAEGAKIGNYLVAVLAMRAAKERSAAEALIVDQQGRVVEGASSNVFFVIDGQLCTPPVEAGILAGITRAGVLEAAEHLKLPTRFATPTVSEIQAADEVFVCSSLREVLPVVELDGVPIGDGRPGALTRRLHAEFRRRAAAAVGVAQGQSESSAD